jgi:hypothetical protein
MSIREDQPDYEVEHSPDQPSERTATGHTPGPWHVGPWHVGRDGTQRVYAHPEHDRWLVAEVSGGDPLLDSWDERKEANARLIAAAPELLAALLEVVYAFDSDDQDLDFALAIEAVMPEIREAIAKARGQS